MPESHFHLPLTVFLCAIGRKETCICSRYWQVRNHLIDVLDDWGLKMSGNTYVREMAEGTKEAWPGKKIIKGDMIIFSDIWEPGIYNGCDVFGVWLQMYCNQVGTEGLTNRVWRDASRGCWPPKMRAPQTLMCTQITWMSC